MEKNTKKIKPIKSFLQLIIICFHNQLMRFSQPLHENTTNIRFSLLGKTFVGEKRKRIKIQKRPTKKKNNIHENEKQRENIKSKPSIGLA